MAPPALPTKEWKQVVKLFGFQCSNCQQQFSLPPDDSASAGGFLKPLQQEKEQLLDEILEARSAGGGITHQQDAGVRNSFETVFQLVEQESQKQDTGEAALLSLGVPALRNWNNPPDIDPLLPTINVSQMQAQMRKAGLVAGRCCSSNTTVQNASERNAWCYVSFFAQRWVARELGAACGNVHHDILADVVDGLHEAVVNHTNVKDMLTTVIYQFWDKTRRHMWSRHLKLVASYVAAVRRKDFVSQLSALRTIEGSISASPKDRVLFTGRFRNVLDYLLHKILSKLVDSELQVVFGTEIGKEEVDNFRSRVLRLALALADTAKIKVLQGRRRAAAAPSLPGPHVQDHGNPLYPFRGGLPAAPTTKAPASSSLQPFPAVVEPALLAFLGEREGRELQRKATTTPLCGERKVGDDYLVGTYLLPTSLATQRLALDRIRPPPTSGPLLQHLGNLLRVEHTCPAEDALLCDGKRVFQNTLGDRTCAEWAQKYTDLTKGVMDKLGGSGHYLPFVADQTVP